VPWAAALAGAALAVPSPAASQVAVLQALDKVTARLSSVEASVNQPVKFGTLQITVRYCRTRPPEEPPETSVFLEVVEIKPDEGPTRVFSGWMFASSPALSALEHPVYDLRVIACKTSAGLAPAEKR
jgi:hypothetical protein